MSADQHNAKGHTHLLTIAVEDYFHATAVRRALKSHHRRRLETRLQRNLERAFALLDEFDIRATFFVLGCVAESHAGAVRAIADAGHEVAARSWDHRSIHDFEPTHFRADVRRSRQALEQAAGAPVRGYRIAERRFRSADYWAMDVLAEEGFTYDSSIYPRFQELRCEPWRRFPHCHRCDGHEIIECPLSSWGPNWFLLPLAGGNSIRQLPTTFVRRAVADWSARYPHPFNMYFNIWELDPDLPRLAIGGLITRLRQYRNLQRMPHLLRYFLKRYDFEPIITYLERSTLCRTPGVCAEPDTAGATDSAPAAAPEPIIAPARSPVPAANLESFSVVIPCYNEEAVLSYTQRALAELAEILEPRPIQYIFVDDGSDDGTQALLYYLFGGRKDCTIIEHTTNRGVTAAIMTGMHAAQTDVVGSMDCDCTYDTRVFARLLPMLADDVAMVTCSPYHPDGEVHNVPGWRLFLSKTLSRAYRLLLRNKLHTFTSCCRVYRKSALNGLQIRAGGFLGMAEMVAALDRNGAVIRECPAVLESRILGTSKMRTLRTIFAHIGLLARLTGKRLIRPFRRAQ